ncbi:hypothetical protein [Gemmata sp.]|uniref:hypothetical protein n=1 Tax=Gemmata sp. TaxID=1914242 RepID=UPI003F71943C
MPESDDAAPRLPADVLRRVARYQRWVIACVLSQLTMWLGLLVLGILNGEWVDVEVPLFLTFVLDLAGAAFSFLIYWTVRDPFWAVVMGLAAVPPIMGLLTMTAVNGTATATLTRNGVRVGFFGAELNEIEGDWFGAYDDEEDAGW